MTELEVSPWDVIDAEIVHEDVPTQANQVADGLRLLAAMVEANPALDDEEGYYWCLHRILVPVHSRDAVRAFARAGLKVGAKVAKHQENGYAGVGLDFGGGVSLHIYTDRQKICERVVVGTREETKEVPDPDLLKQVPKVTVTETVEDVEWRCMPLLAEELPGGVR